MNEIENEHLKFHEITCVFCEGNKENKKDNTKNTCLQDKNKSSTNEDLVKIKDRMIIICKCLNYSHPSCLITHCINNLNNICEICKWKYRIRITKEDMPCSFYAKLIIKYISFIVLLSLLTAVGLYGIFTKKYKIINNVSYQYLHYYISFILSVGSFLLMISLIFSFYSTYTSPSGARHIIVLPYDEMNNQNENYDNNERELEKIFMEVLNIKSYSNLIELKLKKKVFNDTIINDEKRIHSFILENNATCSNLFGNDEGEEYDTKKDSLIKSSLFELADQAQLKKGKSWNDIIGKHQKNLRTENLCFIGRSDENNLSDTHIEIRKSKTNVEKKIIMNNIKAKLIQDEINSVNVNLSSERNDLIPSDINELNDFSIPDIQYEQNPFFSDQGTSDKKLSSKKRIITLHSIFDEERTPEFGNEVNFNNNNFKSNSKISFTSTVNKNFK